MRKVTIQDIADELGISRNTVSKAINNSDGLADATRERILQKATEMGYKQFSYIQTRTGGAQEQKATHKGDIALLFGSDISKSHFALLMVDKLKTELFQLGYSLSTHRVERDDFLHQSLPVTFVPEQAVAIICIRMFDRAYDEMICSLGLPVLFVDGPHKGNGLDLPADQLYMDSSTVVTQFIHDMLARGKRRIGFIGDYEFCQSFYERYSAFRCAMLMAGVPVDERFCLKMMDSEQIADTLSALPEIPDVFICVTDRIAIDAIYTLRRLGKTVPGDILFCGFDDSPNSRIMTPTLTTVHVHTRIMAFTALQLLISRIEDPEINYRIVHTETELIYRDSTKSE